MKSSNFPEKRASVDVGRWCYSVAIGLPSGKVKEIFPGAAKTDSIDSRKGLKLFQLRDFIPTGKGEKMEIFLEQFIGLPRQGPGNAGSTIRAFNLIDNLPENLSILDVGCGSGAQTLTLAKISKGNIIAVDLVQQFLDSLEENAKKEGLEITTLNCSMQELDFEEKSFDLIWSEGAIYNIGFKTGLESWKRFLKPGGTIAVTEASWLTDNPEDEVKRFWAESYPDMKNGSENIRIIKETGYKLINCFTLPEAAWWEDFFIPLEKNIKTLMEKYHGNEEAINIFNASLYEMELYKEYSSQYGYVFYIMRSK